MPIFTATESQIDEYADLAGRAGAGLFVGDATVPQGMCAIFYKGRLVIHGPIGAVQHMVQPGYVIIVSPEDLELIAERQKKTLH